MADLPERLDSYPYRHRLAEVMRAPVLAAGPGATLGAAAKLMADAGVGALIVTDAGGAPLGIVSERDALRALADDSASAGMRTLASLMSSPVETLPADAYVYRAIGRMQRLGIRHLLALDAAGRPAGMVSARALLGQRSGAALTLGDEIDVAVDGAAMRRAHDRLPALAAGLRAEGTPAPQIAAVVSAATRDLTARAAALAVAEAEKSLGRAPARWCVLVLGSAGRGESLLAPDQDNALIHDGDPTAVDAWFAAMAERMNALLDAAGVPYCKGGVMAKNPAWRRSLDGWRAQTDAWLAAGDGETILNVDIFCDFVPVAGDVALAGALRAHVTAAAQEARALLRLMAANVESSGGGLGFFGRFRTAGGRLDLKRTCLLPIVSAARIMALRHGVPATGTAARLEAVAEAGKLGRDNAASLAHALATAQSLILAQQGADIAAGIAPSAAIDPKRLTRAADGALRHALARAEAAKMLLRDALSA